MAEPEETPEDMPQESRRTEFTGPTNQLRPDSQGVATDAVAGRAVSAIEAIEVEDDDEETGIQHTPPPRRATLSAIAATPARFMLALQEGSPVGEYEIQSQIGEGAMGTVYSAIHPLIGKTVAIKVLKPELCSNQASVDRFVQEAQAVNRIGHPNIVDVFMLGELPDGRAYFVMEWLRGEDLKSRLGKGRIPINDTCNILSGISRALEAAHGKGVVHRDLKPDNVFLQQVDSGPILVKLLDFGIAKLMREKTMEKTQTGNMLGTPRYISPEQARGVDVTHRADIYSLGVMAYEMLAGRPPFLGETGMDLVVKHLNEAPPPLSDLVRVPRSLERCVMSMLAKDPAERPTLTAVRRVLEDPTRKVTIGDIPRPAKTSRRRAVVLVVLVGALGVGGWQAYERDWFGDDEPLAVALPAAKPIQQAAPVPKAAPEPKPVAHGTLSITVKGANDATISVDGAEVGQGKAITLRTIDVGLHEVTATVGKDAITETIAVEEDQVAELTLTMSGSQTVRPTRPVRPPIRKPPTQKPKQPPSDLLTPKGMRK